MVRGMSANLGVGASAVGAESLVVLPREVQTRWMTAEDPAAEKRQGGRALSGRRGSERGGDLRYSIMATIDEEPVPLKLTSTVQAEIVLRRDRLYRVILGLDKLDK